MPVIYDDPRPRQRRARRVRDSAAIELQRARIIAAAIATVQAEGRAGLTVAKVITSARVSRKTFYDLFVDTEDCFLAAFEHGLERARRLAVAAHDARDGWQDGMRAAVLAVLEEMEQQRGLARLCVVDALAGGERVLASRTRVLGELAAAIAEGARQHGVDHGAVSLTGHAVAGGIAELLHSRLLRDDPAPLTSLAGPLMSMIVMPSLGRAAACAEFNTLGASAAAHVPRSRPKKAGNPLAGVNMRFTYRTVRVMIAIAEYPGASNREIAKQAGIVDQGQISKLLRRLEGLKLIENLGEGRLRGAPNAWRLTVLGAEVQRATRGI